MIQLAEKTLAGLCLEASARYGERTAFTKAPTEKRRDLRVSDLRASVPRVSYRMMGHYSRQSGLMLRRLGIVPGDRVLILSENCPEWPIAYFGIALAGAVSVPLLTGFSPDQVRYIIGHAQASALFLSRAMAGKIGQLPEHLPVIIIDDITSGISVSCGGQEKSIPPPITETGAEIFPRRRPEDLASVIYTSGTFGNSKGVMLSNLNLISSALSSLSMVKLFRRDRLLSVLPLAHAYECSLGLIAPVLCGAGITYLDRPPSPSVLLPAARALRPTIMVTVPVFIEKMYHSAAAPALRKSRLYQNPLTRPLAVRFAGRKIISALGGKIRFFGIGGAPLSADVEQFLRRARFPFSIGYGLTEAAPLVAGNAPRRFPLRSSGSAPAGVELRIASDDTGTNAGGAAGVGEIQVRGPNVMMGYYRDRAKTREAFTRDGWLRTGDLGCIDKKGKLYIRGRLKALILGPGGENIYPEEIEDLLGSSHLVEEALVYSGEKGELVALVKLDEAAKAAASAVEHAGEELRIWANKKLAAFSRLSRIEIRHEPFEKTPTMKIKRYLYA